MAQTLKAIHLRMFMYALTFSLHFVNVVLTHVWCYKIRDDPEMKLYFPYWTRLFTVWNIGMQMAHAFIGLICDRDELKDTKNRSRNINYLRNFNSTFFSAVVWPSSWVCCIIFWFFYTYDKNLLRYSLIKKVMNPVTNHIGHTFILAVVIWEAVFRPRPEPKSHRRNVFYALGVTAIYTAVLWYTYVTSGTWVYPFFDLSYGTIYFPLIHIVTGFITVGAYFALWPITRITIAGVGFEKYKKRLVKNLGLQKILQ
ncbi:androgen-dependent TFPI-regulating protein-like [Aricia agestis]|uniref:androgen-dependent TFPI-regulating protein-like n=1 Tax=Aricia agestis TaxID=91739 RepID=UPI001C209521|nr:androgen-dependent TFPI-regulating protein-like [Aricia agestis]